MIKKLFRKKDPAPAPAPSPVIEERTGGVFSTDMEPVQRGTVAARYQKAFENSIQIAPGSLKAVDAEGSAMDSSLQQSKVINNTRGFIPLLQFEYYASQGFIGWQSCAIIAQNWLVNKICSLPARDAVRHGYEITVNDGTDLAPEIFDAVRRLDKKMKIKKQCIEFEKFKRVFGIRHALFIVDGIDYEAPFNIDGVMPGAYKGISQIDPYWIAPELDSNAASNPASADFYEPTWWRVNGKRIHKSHFVIALGDEVPDLLKPSYIYGGLPVPQKIYERVYAAERTANEGPMLAQTKRLTVLMTDTSKALANMDEFNEKMAEWVQLMNNYGIKIIGKDTEEINQFDTSLADVDAVIMTQYQLVCAAGEMPATKVLGTSPKGFNATGEYDEASYHEDLESIQENTLSPLVERHHQLLMRAYIAPKFGIEPVNLDVNWLPVDSPTAAEQATTNKTKADTDATLVTAGAIDGYDVRQRLIGDRDSGYNGIADIVPGGPGDRVAEQEEKQAALENDKQAAAQDTAIEGTLDPALGTINGARIITHQRYLNEDVVMEKIATKDYMVNLSPEFEENGKKYRMVIDGHHSLAAALSQGIHPEFIESIPRDVVFNPVTGQATDAKE